MGDDFNFQIKLYETSNLVKIVYGGFTAIYNGAPPTIQVGLRGASNADFSNRMTDATHFWADSLAGTANTSFMTLNDTTVPPTSLIYDWNAQDYVALYPDYTGATCRGTTVNYPLTAINSTSFTDTLDIVASGNVWPTNFNPTSLYLVSNASGEVNASVHVPWTATVGAQDVVTLTATGQLSGLSGSAVLDTKAAMFSGYADYANVPIGREARAPSVIYDNGKLYKISGYGYPGGVGDAQPWLDIYDIATNTWTAGADMPGGSYWIDCEAINGNIYCAGGYLSSGQTTLYIYNIATNTWSTGAALPASRYNYASVQLGGKYYVIGGYTTTIQATMLAYDPTTDTWDTTLPNMSTARRYHMAGVIGGKIYVAGGYNPSYLSSAEVYDPALNSWSPIASMPDAWLNAADGVVHDRYLVLVGGAATSTGTASNGALIYDTLTDTWNWLPLYNHIIYGAEGDGDGTEFWVVSGRLYEGTWSNSPYTTRLLECEATCTPVGNADFTWVPVVPWTNNSATFTAFAASGSPEITYNWDFGDGSTGNGEVIAHTYALTGTFEVTLTTTNCDGASTSVAIHDVTVILPPTISVDPDSLHATHYLSQTTTQALEICITGDYTLTWELGERPVSEKRAAGPLAPTDYGYALEMYSSDNFVTFQLNDFSGQTVVGPNTTPFYGMDFDPTATVLYALNDTTDELGTIDLTTGAFTGLVPCPPGGGAANWTGFTIAQDGTFYAATATDLYIIDPATGNSTLVGSFGTTTMIAIAIKPDGEMYGHDITSDSIYQIDPTIGVATLVGPTGYTANYAQGKDFDNEDGTLFIFLYTGGGSNVYGTVNLTTGAVTPLSISNPTCEFEGATQTPMFLPDIPWLSEDPITGTLSARQCSMVDVTFDSNGLDLGEYYGDLIFTSNDPATPKVTVPVTLTFLAPPLIEFNYYDLEDVVQIGEDVTIVGDFTGWATDQITMTPNVDYSVFTATVPIIPGSYGYKYFMPDLPDWSSYDMLNTSDRNLIVSGDVTVNDYRKVAVGWANLGDPVAITITLGENSGNLVGEVFVANVTNPVGEGRGIVAQFGYSVDPADSATWSWVDMAYTGDNYINDLFAVVITPTVVGSYIYGVRFDGNWGVGNPNIGWTYGDRTGMMEVLSPIIPPRLIYLPLM